MYATELGKCTKSLLLFDTSKHAIVLPLLPHGCAESVEMDVGCSLSIVKIGAVMTAAHALCLPWIVQANHGFESSIIAVVIGEA